MNTGDSDAAIVSCQARVYGRVQGVGYREACVRHARAHGITGWVRNRMDGSVEVMLQGSPQQLEEMCHWLRHGHSVASVDELKVTQVPLPAPTFETFDRLHTL